jgi:Icc-related predicted phosphoesterase
MILLLGDCHCQYPVINNQIDYAEQKCGQAVASVIQLGDFGLYESELVKYFSDIKSPHFKRPIHLIDGNHEDFWHFDHLVKKYHKFFKHLPRGSVQKIDGYKFLCLGGASYMDPINTPPGSVITDEDIEKCLYHNSQDIDIIISHDCPQGIGVPGTVGFEYCGEPGFPRSREILNQIKPKLWIFAHHHKWHQICDQNTGFYGLDVAYNGSAVLDQNFKITFLKQPAKHYVGLSNRFYGKEDHLWPVYRSSKWREYIKRFFKILKSRISKI